MVMNATLSVVLTWDIQAAIGPVGVDVFVGFLVGGGVVALGVGLGLAVSTADGLGLVVGWPRVGTVVGNELTRGQSRTR
jgi:hypothetical protein